MEARDCCDDLTEVLAPDEYDAAICWRCGRVWVVEDESWRLAGGGEATAVRRSEAEHRKRFWVT